MRNLCFKEIGFIFPGLGVEGGDESKQKLEPLKKTETPCLLSAIPHLNAQPCSEDAGSGTGSPAAAE